MGRFLSLDPLADAGGQQVLSPYHAMGCNPVSMVDPLGLQYFAPQTPMTVQDPAALARFMAPTLLKHMPGGGLWDLSNMNRYITQLPKELRAEAWMMYLSGGNSSSFGLAYERVLFQRDMRNLRNEREYSNTELEGLTVVANKPQWADWGKRMAERFGTSLGYSFEGYGQEASGRGKMPSLFSTNLMTTGSYSNASEMPVVSIYKGAIVIKSSFVDGGAIALPPFIIIDPNESDVQETLRHEYGHQIQSVIVGLGAYYLYLGLPSLLSAREANNNYEYNHQEFYSEKSANQLSYWFHGKPSDWKHEYYPVYIK